MYFPELCAYSDGYVDSSKWLVMNTTAETEYDCAEIVKNQKVLATGMQWHTESQECWAVYGYRIAYHANYKNCIFSGILSFNSTTYMELCKIDL